MRTELLNPSFLLLMSESEQKVPLKTTKPDIAATVKTLQFAWYVGHVITVLSTILYALTYVGVFKGAYVVWYKLALLGVIGSFGVLIFQTVKKNGASPQALLRDDNVHYFFLGLSLFVVSPYVFLTLTTFFLFSTFHVLSYTKHYLLPAFDIPDTHILSVKIGEFVAANNSKSIALASALEVFTLVWLLLRTIAFRKRSLLPLLVYLVFIKLRFEKSQFTRDYFKTLELKIEDLATKSGQPAVKDVWVKVKAVFAKIGAVHLVNDFSKEKAT